MLVVDASCLFAVVSGAAATTTRRALAADTEQIAPHVVDVEVLGVIRRLNLAGDLDQTAAQLALQGLREWPGERFGHRPFLDRAWELRDRVRGWDAMYVALAEAMRATLLTFDERLARVDGLLCEIRVPSPT